MIDPEWQELSYEEIEEKFSALKNNAMQHVLTHKLLFPDVTVEQYNQSLDSIPNDLDMMKEKYDAVEFHDLLKTWGQSFGRNIFHFTAYFGLSNLTTSVLYEKGSLYRYNKKDIMDMTPLDYAEQEGHTEVAKLLRDFEEKRGGKIYCD